MVRCSVSGMTGLHAGVTSGGASGLGVESVRSGESFIETTGRRWRTKEW
jgi:hypothetical protein